MNLLRRRRPKVATFYHSGTPATAYLRCELPARHLPAQLRSLQIAVEMNDEDYRFPEHEGDAAVMQLVADRNRAVIALLMREKGIRVLVESDDNYLDSPGRQIRRRQQWGKRIGDDANTVQGHLSIVREASGVIVATPYLAGRYRTVNPNVYIARNSVDPADWPKPKKPDDGVLRIGWVASLSHLADIPLVTKAFEWASRQPGVEVYAAGLDPRWKFKYGYLPWLDDLADYRTIFSHFDIGVAPIKPTPFTLGRSDVKALEYAMGLCAPVLSDVAPYADWQHDATCLKAKDAKGFHQVIQHLVRNPDEARQLAAAARAYTLEQRTIKHEIGAWEEAIRG